MDSPQSDEIPVPVAQPTPKEFWRSFGFEPEGDDIFGLRCTLPPGLLVFSAEEEHRKALVDVVKAIGVQTLSIHADKRRWDLYRVEAAFDVASAMVPDGVRLDTEGNVIRLPYGNDFTPKSYSKAALSELPLLTVDDLARSIQLKGYSPVVDSPLAKHSLRGRSEEFERMAVKAEPLLGDIALTGQATVLYAPPNAGKTLIGLGLLTEAVEQRRINPGNVYYINADDNSEGLATKLGLMDDFSPLSPSFRSIAAPTVVPIMFFTRHSPHSVCEWSALVKRMFHAGAATMRQSKSLDGGIATPRTGRSKLRLDLGHSCRSKATGGTPALVWSRH